jgi:hypothetical protein
LAQLLGEVLVYGANLLVEHSGDVADFELDGFGALQELWAGVIVAPLLDALAPGGAVVVEEGEFQQSLNSKTISAVS